MPFNENLQNGQLETFEGLSDEETTALEVLKAKLMEPPALGLPHLQGDYTVKTDACDKQIGWV